MSQERLEGYQMSVAAESFVDTSEPGGRIATRTIVVLGQPGHTVVIPLTEEGIDMLIDGLSQAKAQMRSGLTIARSLPPSNPGTNGGMR